MKHVFIFLFLLCVCGHDIVPVSVLEGDSVTLYTDIETIQQEEIRWYFNDFCIAEITGDQSKNSTDVQCNNGAETFRNRLKVNYTTGSLTITNISTTDSGLYKLQINSSRFSIIKSFIVNVTGYADAEKVSVMEGDSITLYTDTETIQQEEIRWYFNEIHIAEITVDSNETCKDVKCDDGKETFRNRLKVNYMTGSLTITNIRTTDSGLFKLQINSSSDSLLRLFSVSVYYDPEGDKLKTKSVKEGDSVILDPGVERTTNYLMKWIFNDIRIAEINGDLSFICTDVQCLYADVRFRGRLKLNHMTGSLTITNTRTTDSGLYYLLITTIRFSIVKTFSVNVNGYVDAERVTVMEGDSVTLHTDVETNQQEEIRWYFHDIRIAQTTGDLGFICTDVQCKHTDERFRDRLELDHQTGSLTIRYTRTIDSGFYHNQVISGSSISHKLFIVTVCGVSAAERDEMKRKSAKEGESVTLDTGMIKNPNEVMTWYFNDSRIAEITGGASKICTDDQCDERFRDRLKLDHQTGSLTIRDITNTDAGVYKLQINSSRISIVKNFSITLPRPIPHTPDTDLAGSESGLPLAAIAGIVCVGGAVVLLFIVAGVIYGRKRKEGQRDIMLHFSNQMNGTEDPIDDSCQ